MKKTIIAVVLSLSLGGCAAFQSFVDTTQKVVTAATVGIDNPVTPKVLYEAELTMKVATDGLVAYRRACLGKTIPVSCRGVIVKLQVYTKQMPRALATVRGFVRNNDQVNALTAYRTFQNLVSDFKQVAATNGVN